MNLGTALALLGAGLAVGLSGIGSGIGVGIVGASSIGVIGRKPEKFGKAIMFSAIPQTQAIYGLLVAIIILLKTGILFKSPVNLSLGTGLAALAAGVSVGFAGLSAIGQGVTAAAGISTVAEDESMFGQSIVFSVIPETQAIYGLLVAILILLRTGFMGGSTSSISPEVGLVLLGAAFAVGIAGTSAIGQGITAAAGIGSMLKNRKIFGKAIVFSAISETHAVFGLLMAFIIFMGVGLFGTLGKVSLGTSIAALASGLSIGLAATSAIGLGITAAVGVKVISRKPELFGRAIIFSIIPETQVIYGLLIAILIALGAGIIGGRAVNLPWTTAVALLGAALAVGYAGSSAIGQGITAAEGISSAAERTDIFGKAIVFSVIPESQAIFGLLIAIITLIGTGLLGGGIKDLALGTSLALVGAGLAVGLAGSSAIGLGITAGLGIRATLKSDAMFGKSLLFSVVPETQAIYGLLVAILIVVATGIFGGAPKELPLAVGIAAMGAGLAVGFAGTSAIGQGITAGYAIVATSRKPELFGRSMVFSVIPETQAIYGLLTAILIMIGLGLFGGAFHKIPISVAIALLGAGAATGFAGTSAIGQGITAAYGIWGVERKPELFGRAIVFSVIPETQAIYGLLIAILIFIGTGVIGMGVKNIPLYTGIAVLGAGLAVGLAGASAIGQGIAAGAGINTISEREAMFGRSIVFSILSETHAIFGLLIAILIYISTGLLFGAPKEISLAAALVALGAGIAIGYAGYSAVGLGITTAVGVGVISQREEAFGRGLLFSVIPETQLIYAMLIAIILLLRGGFIVTSPGKIPLSFGIAAIGMGLAVGLAAYSAIGQGVTAACGLISTVRSEKMFGKSLLFSVIPETQAIYGLLTALIAGVIVGIVGAVKSFPFYWVVPLIGAGLAVGLAGLSAVGQGITAGAGINVVQSREGVLGRAVLFSALSETFAIFGLLIAILIFMGLSLL